MDNLERLLYLRGVALEFIDYSGAVIRIPQEDRLGILRSMGIDVDEQEAVEAEIERVDAQPWRSWLPPLQVVDADEAALIEIRFAPGDLGRAFDWELESEQGQRWQGSFLPKELRESGEYRLNGERYNARHYALPVLPVGYHRLRLNCEDRSTSVTLAAAPRRCFEPAWSAAGQRIWGVCAQLYTLRRPQDWGMGDFAALEELIVLAAAEGAELIGLNPLHALDIRHPENCSPYSPRDRRWINPLYIAPELSLDYQDCPEVDGLLEEIHLQLQVLRHCEHIDYQRVAALKYRAFALMYRRFVRVELPHGSRRSKQFHEFLRRGGAQLEQFCRHEAARAPSTMAEGEDPRFHQYLQWLADTQLERCQRRAEDSGMALGLMRDLAVGAVPGGCEVESAAELFCDNSTVGAPPDAWAPQGQNWGLVPPDPKAMRDTGFAHFISLLRSNMSHCGALRIDHVMALMRLWWCPRDAAHGAGAYVHYPVDELFALLRLESVRNRCLVIGEDLGVVPPEVRPYLDGSGIYTNVLFYFEKDHGAFRHPDHYPQRALAMVANHDVPTLCAWWSGNDLKLRRELGLIEDDERLARELDGRAAERQGVRDWLTGLGLLSEPGTGPEDELDLATCGAILQACSGSRAQILTVQPEDLCFESRPINIPGTNSEYGNWRRRLSPETAELFADGRARTLMRRIAERRNVR